MSQNGKDGLTQELLDDRLMATAMKHDGVDQAAIRRHVRGILLAIGENPDREGLVDTPARVARWWEEFAAFDPGNIGTAFQSIHTDQLVAVTGVRVWSLCEHHLLPFWCDVSIGYVAQDKVLGLSKFARIAEKYAHRLQLQERLVDDVANAVREQTGSESVAVVGRGMHLCMMMRGPRHDAIMVSSALHGVFRTNPHLRAEFFQLVDMDRRRE